MTKDKPSTDIYVTLGLKKIYLFFTRSVRQNLLFVDVLRADVGGNPI
jgi:hypothetical protein